MGAERAVVIEQIQIQLAVDQQPGQPLPARDLRQNLTSRGLDDANARPGNDHHSPRKSGANDG